MDAPEILRGVVIGLHHVAIAVESLEEGRRFYEGLGMVPGEVEHVPTQGVHVLVLEVGPTRIELVEPTSEDSTVGRFLARRGAGVHHLAWRVSSVAEAIEQLKARGLRMVHDSPQPGSGGTTIAFVHPSSTGGVLMELVEDGASDSPE